MTHPASVRQEALARLTAGESQREVAKALGIGNATVSNWVKLAEASVQEFETPVRERMGHDFMRAAVLCVTRTLELLPHQDSVRDTSYAARVLSQTGMDLLEWSSKGTAINIDARTQVAGNLTLNEIDARIAALKG